jgi:putative (di)nucleoside polyphosphate hydrolase
MQEDDYRHGVCVVLKKRGSSLILVCHRVDCSPGEGWQLPQGGIDKKKDLINEARRELREEIGTDNISVLAISSQSYCYEYPEGARHKNDTSYIGQCHKWIVAEFNGSDQMIRFEHTPREFDSFEWVTPAEALRRIVDFKQKSYKKAFFDLNLLIDKNLE